MAEILGQMVLQEGLALMSHHTQCKMNHSPAHSKRARESWAKSWQQCWLPGICSRHQIMLFFLILAFLLQETMKRRTGSQRAWCNLLWCQQLRTIAAPVLRKFLPLLSQSKVIPGTPYFLKDSRNIVSSFVKSGWICYYCPISPCRTHGMCHMHAHHHTPKASHFNKGQQNLFSYTLAEATLKIRKA